MMIKLLATTYLLHASLLLSPFINVESLVLRSPYWVRYCAKWYPTGVDTNFTFKEHELPDYIVKQFYYNIRSIASICGLYTERASIRFMRSAKVDIDFQDSTEHMELAWLPDSAVDATATLRDVKYDRALQNTTYVMKHFLIALEVMIEDETVQSAKRDYTTIRNKLIQLLCEAESVMKTLGVVDISANVTDDVVPQSGRNLKNKRSLKFIRNWIVLRDLMSSLTRVDKVFTKLINTRRR